MRSFPVSAMNNTLLHDPRPSSLNACVDEDGQFDPVKFCAYTARMGEESRQRIANAVNQSYAEHLSDDDLSWDEDDETPPKKRRAKKTGVMARRTDDGELEPILPEDTIWWAVYINNFPVDDRRSQAKFRNRFRLPHANFRELVLDCKQNELFSRWLGKDAVGQDSSPIELLILGTLRYLGRGWTFDDLEESTAISREVHRVFFHQFIEFGSTVLVERYINTPVNAEEASRHMAEFKMAGLDGGMASSDGTHVVTEGCEYNLKQVHKGGKTDQTTRTFNTTVNHRRRVLHTTKGGPGRWNDKTMVRFDEFLCGIRSGKILEDIEFELLEIGPEGEVVTVKYQGGYVIVDNGYLRWSCTVPPFKVTLDQREIRWSKWVESMRKDVECTFGILKGRWRILKTGIRVEGVDAVDKIWLTCCALHNWLLDIDGLDEHWDGDGLLSTVESDWTGEMGNHDFVFEGKVPDQVSRLVGNLDPRYDASGLGAGTDVAEAHPIDLDTEDVDDESVNFVEGEVRVVKNLSLGYFRKKLVEHFDIKWQRNEIKWPSRRGPAPVSH